MEAKNGNISLMAIINLTDDSFYSGSRTVREGRVDLDLVVARVAAALAEGASIIDLGASSSRPGSVPVGEKVEISRLEPALEVLSKKFPETLFSIDTTRAAVIAMGYKYLDKRLMVNDISSGEDDPEMLPLAGKLGLTFIAMHGWDPKRHSEGNVVERVISYFREFSETAAKYGISDWIVDPGFGFSKTIDENWELLRGFTALKEFGRPILVGVSRKSMIYKPLGLGPEDVLEQTQDAHRLALAGGASILRVHDVAPASATCRLYYESNK